MLDSILDSVLATLTAKGFSALREFPNGRASRGGPLVTIGLETAKCLSSGMGDYLGVRTAESGEISELYGRRLDLSLLLEIFVPYELGAVGCMRCADELRLALEDFPEGICPMEMDCGEVVADEEISSFRCTCRVKCLAFLVAEDKGTQGEFLDFILKGVVELDNK